jgi:glycosyltransferase involved in cell wall biosynthesis
MSPIFTIVIPTRNRSKLLQRAIDSIEKQTIRCFSIILVDDGSTAETKKQLVSIASKYDDLDIKIESLPAREKGHGPSFSRNTGAFMSTTDYVTFLDDDDEIIDVNYFETLIRLIKVHDSADVFIANQQAQRFDGTIINKNIWLENYLLDEGGEPIYRCSEYFDDKIEFPHINTLVIKKSLFKELGGFDESLRYEEDRDFFYRLTEIEPIIFTLPNYTHLHYVPDNRKSASTIEAQKKFETQVSIFLRALNNTQSEKKRNMFALSLSYTFKHLVSLYMAEKSFQKALFSAKLAQCVKPSVKYLLFVQYLKFLALINQGK